MNYVKLNEVEYPTRNIILPGYGWVTVSTEELNDELFTEAGDYVSDAARVVDEEIFFFVPEDILMNASDFDLSEFVLSSL